jgi:ribonuclease HI
MDHFQVFCDGGARGNPGPAASAFVVKDEKDELIYQRGFYIGETTNNQAEYTAVLRAIEWLVENMTGKEFTFYLDSQLVVNQISGKFKVKDTGLIEKKSQILSLLNQGKIKINCFTYIPREKNYHADKLVNITLDNAYSEKRP